jgi:hypothetical protein
MNTGRQTVKHTPYILRPEPETVNPKPGADAHGEWTESAVCEAQIWQPYIRDGVMLEDLKGGKGDVKDGEDDFKDGQIAEEGNGFEVP